MKTLRALALSYPDVEEGVACKGTALECATFKARNKAFLFLGAKELKLKLGPSLAEAVALDKKQPGAYKVGAHGWVAISVAQSPPVAMLRKWLAESYALVAPPERSVAIDANMSTPKRKAKQRRKPS